MPEIRHELTEALSLPGDGPGTLDAFRLCLTELIANVVRHAYPDRSGRLEIAASRDADRVRLTVRDWGVGLRPSENPGLGLGLKLLRELADHVDVRESGGTEIEAHFNVRSPAHEPAGDRD